MLAYLKIALTCCLIAFLIVSTVPMSFSYSDGLIGVQVTNKTIGVNQLSLGFQLDWEDWQLFTQRSILKVLAKDANFGLVRVFDFRQTDPRLMPCTYWNESSKTGKWNWTYVDGLVRAIFGVGAEPLFCLGWANNYIQDYIPLGMAVDPVTGLPHPDSYASYASVWVRHFKSLGQPVRYYEIMNEPHFYFGWNAANTAKLAYFVKLWNATAKAMRQENSDLMLSHDSILIRYVFDYWLTHGENVDYLDFHKYGADKINQYNDSEMLSLAETRKFETSSLFYGVNDARQKWYNARHEWLPVINSESNFNSALETGQDPKIQKMIGATWLALVLRTAILKGLSYNVYFELASSASDGSSRPSGGFGFGMINSDTNKPWYPYYVQKMMGQTLAVNDKLMETVSSSPDVRTLAWLHNGTLMILLICKTDGARNVVLQGVTGQVNYSRVDNAIPWQTPQIQAGTLDSSDVIAMTGYTVMLLQGSISGAQPPASLQKPLFDDDFESGNFSAWAGTSVTSGEKVTVVGTLSYQKNYSARFSSNGTGGYESAYSYESMPNSSKLYAGGYFYVSQSGIKDNGDRFYLIVFSANGNGVAYAGWRRVGGVDRWSLLIRNGTGWVSADSDSDPSLNRWYCLELYWVKDSVYGHGELWVDGALKCSIRSQNTTAFGDIDQARFGLSEVYGCSASTVYNDFCLISVVPVWDLNQDGVVDMRDSSSVARAFWSDSDSPDWNPSADFNANGIVDLKDLATVARHFGERYA